MYNRIFKHKNIISYVIVLFLTILSFKTVCLSQRELAFIDDTGFPLGGTSSIAAMLNSAQIESVRETEGANARLVENRQTLIRSSLLRNAASFEAMPLQCLMPARMLIIICRLMFLIISLSLIFIMRYIHDKDGRKKLLSLLYRSETERKDSNVRKGYNNNLHSSMFMSSNIRMVDGKWTIT